MASSGSTTTIRRLDRADIYFARFLMFTTLGSLPIRLVSVATAQRATVNQIMVVLLLCANLSYQVISLLGWRFYYGIIDWSLLSLLVSVEVAWIILYEGSVYGIDLAIVIVLVFKVAVILLWLIRTLDIVLTRGRVLFIPFDPLARHVANSPPGTGNFRKYPRVNAFLGDLGDSPLRGEIRATRIVRPIVATLILVVLFNVFAYAVIIQPLNEESNIPIKSSLSQTSDFGSVLETPFAWNIVVATTRPIFISETETETDAIEAAVTVNPLWEHASPCEHVPSRLTFFSVGPGFAYGSINGLKLVTFFCPNGSFYSSPPDLLITVNFTMLNITSPSPVNASSINATALSTSHERTVHIFHGLTNDTTDVLANTLPIPLIAGQALFGAVVQRVRKQLVGRSLSSLSPFHMTKTFLISQLVTLYPDPLLIPLPDIATLRLVKQPNIGGFYIEEEYRDRSVWSGFATLGGLWTFLNGIFAVVFGTGLLFSFFGKKHISIFGLVHFLQNRTQLCEALRADYPRIYASEKLEGAGLLTFLKDYVVDIGAIEEREGSAYESSERDGVRAVEGHRYEELETRGDTPQRDGQRDGGEHSWNMSRYDVPLAEYNSTA